MTLTCPGRASAAANGRGGRWAWAPRICRRSSGKRALALLHALARAGEDPLEDASLMAARPPRHALEDARAARPVVERLARAWRAPSRRSAARPATTSAAAAFSTTTSRGGPRLAGQHARARCAALCGGVAAAQVVRGAGRAARRPRRSTVNVRTAPSRHSDTRVGAAERQLVEARAVDHPGPRARRAARRQRAMKLGQLRPRHAHHLRLGQRGVGERAEQVEHGAHARAPCAAPRRGAWRRGSAGAKRKAQPASSRQRWTVSSGRVDAHAQRLQHVGAAAAAAGRAVAVLGHGHAAGRDHQRGHGRDVEGARAVAAGAAGVDGARRRAAARARARIARAKPTISSSVSPRTARAASSAADLRRRGLAVHDRAHGRARLVLGQALAARPPAPRWRFRTALTCALQEVPQQVLPGAR